MTHTKHEDRGQEAGGRGRGQGRAQRAGQAAHPLTCSTSTACSTSSGTSVSRKSCRRPTSSARTMPTPTHAAGEREADRSWSPKPRPWLDEDEEAPKPRVADVGVLPGCCPCKGGVARCWGYTWGRCAGLLPTAPPPSPPIPPSMPAPATPAAWPDHGVPAAVPELMRPTTAQLRQGSRWGGSWLLLLLLLLLLPGPPHMNCSPRSSRLTAKGR